MIASSANRYFTFYKRTAFVKDAAQAADSITLDRSLDADSFLEVEVSGGTTGSGSVVISGTDPSGASQSETLTFAANGVQQTINRWKKDTTPTVTTTGFSDEATVPTLSIKACDASGQPQIQNALVVSSRPCVVSIRFDLSKYHALNPGSFEEGHAYFNIDYEEIWTPQVGYLLVEDSTNESWTINAVEPIYVGFGVRINHYRLSCRRYDT